MSALHYCVIGSGPAGISCAKALIHRNIHVTLLDVGKTYKTETLSLIEKLRATSLRDWKNSEAFEKLYQDNSLDSSKHIPEKKVFGSSFPYEERKSVNLIQNKTKCLISHAKGGFSNVWGGAILPYQATDFEGWPITLEDLKPYYKKITQEMGISGVRDSLEEIFPLYTNPQESFSLSNQAQLILNKMKKNKSKLNLKGVFFGQSRIGVNIEGGRKLTCCYQGVCLGGCPFFVIYNSIFTLNKWVINKTCTYKDNFLVTEVQELENNKVEVKGFIQNGLIQKNLTFDRVFIACGPIASSKIIINSLKKYDQPLSLKYNPYFVLPLLSIKRAKYVSRENLHTLSQLFIEICNKKISHYPLHLQLYGFNSFIEKKVNQIKFLANSAVKNSILDRLLFIQGYLHSSEVSDIQLNINRLKDDRLAVYLESKEDKKIRRVVRSLSRFLFSNVASLGFIPLHPLAVFGLPGEGNHIGGIFPMRHKPQGHESDDLGRIAPFKRTHVVDASVLTGLPAPTLTFTVMANAYRIGDQVPPE